MSLIGDLWLKLREAPLGWTSWMGLASVYADLQLPWHKTYVQRQARKCPGFVANEHYTISDKTDWLDTDIRCLETDGQQRTVVVSVIEGLEQQIAREPADWLSWLYLARCREIIAGDSSESFDGENVAVREAVVQALRFEPIRGETGHILAQWRLRAGSPARALAALQATLLQSPKRYSSWLLQAEAQMQCGLENDAKHSFERAGESQNPAFLGLLADKLFVNNFGAESLAVRKVVAELMPLDVGVWIALSNIQKILWQTEQAQESLNKALALDPGHKVALQLHEDLLAAGDSRAQFDLELKRFNSEGLRENGIGSARLLMQSLYQPHLSPIEVSALHRRVGEALTNQAISSVQKKLPVTTVLPWGQRRLRVGYVTGDLHRQHPVNIFMLPVLKEHDHSRVKVFVYHTGTLIDEYTRQAMQCVDRWCECAHIDDFALYEKITDDQIDVLVDLSGHTASARMGLFAMRPAVVQMSYLGYPHSTGLPFIDWLIADPIVAPPEHQGLFSERIAYVGGSVFCWHPVDEYPLPSDFESAVDRPIVFGSFNNLLKVNNQVLEVWARVLREVENSRLLLKAPVLADKAIRIQTLSRLAAFGISSSQVDLRGPSELSEMMQEYLDVHIALDTFPYNGGTTSLQAMWMGCPIVTLQGNNFVSRMGASFLSAIDRIDWIAEDADKYVEIARNLASILRTKPWSRCSQRLAMQSSNLCNIVQQTRDLEDIYIMAFEDALLTNK